MANITPWEVERQWLIHPSIYDQVPDDDLPDIMCDAVRELVDLDEIEAPYLDDTSFAPHYPAMMVALLFHAWSQEVFSSRAIARACERQVGFMALTAMAGPSWTEVRAFRERHAAPLIRGLVRVLRAADRLRLPWGAADEEDDDATGLSFGRAEARFEATAAGWLEAARAADSAEDALLGEELRDARLPKWIGDKKKRVRKLRDAREAIERQERARLEAERLLLEDDERDDEPARELVEERGAPDPVPPPIPPPPENPLARRRGSRRSQRPGRARVASAPDVAPPPSTDEEAPRSQGAASHGLHRPRRSRPRSRVSSSTRSSPPAEALGRSAARHRPASRSHAGGERRGRHRSSEGPSGSPPSEVFLRDLSASARVILVETAVATAMADGDVAAIEQRRIDKLIRLSRLGTRARQKIYATVRDGVAPPLPTPAELPDYDVRLHVFEEAAIMALADGEVQRAEHRYLKELAESLELSISDAKQALRRANAATGG